MKVNEREDFFFKPVGGSRRSIQCYILTYSMQVVNQRTVDSSSFETQGSLILESSSTPPLGGGGGGGWEEREKWC